MPRSRLANSVPLQVMALTALALALFASTIGFSGLSMSEGHRAAPGWEMLRTGDWLVPHMFERPYLRKPPGMPWAIAASSAVFGETAFAARLVSVLATAAAAVAVCVFAARWYGTRWGLSAGLALLLMPVLWGPARSAEIEALHNLFVLLAAGALLDAGGLHRAATPASRLRASLLAGAGIAGAILTKGPAGLPVVGAAAVALLLTPGLPRERLASVCMTALVAAGVLLAPVFALGKLAVAQLTQTPVTQGVDEFLWARSNVPLILLLPAAALLACLPASLAMLFPWGPDARREADAEPTLAPARTAARTVSLTVLIAVVAYALIGVSNPRYAMPAAPLAALVVPYVLIGIAAGFTPTRTRIARALTAGGPPILTTIMLVACLIAGVVRERSRISDSGEALGRELAALIAPGAAVWADHAIEARPEVLLAARRHAEMLGHTLRPLWKPIDADSIPESGGYLLLREDNESGEAARGAAEGWLAGFDRVGGGQVSKYKLGLYLRR